MNKLVYSVNTDFKKDLTCFSNLNLQTDDLDVTNIKQMDGSNIYIKQTRNFKEHNIVKLRKNILLNNVFIKTYIFNFLLLKKGCGIFCICFKGIKGNGSNADDLRV